MPGGEGEREVRAECFKLLENHADEEGWVLTGPYLDEPTASVEQLLERCPELARLHFIPSRNVDVW